MSTIRAKRVYEETDKSDGYRILVDGLWPRGLTRNAVHADVWLKEIAPSAELRKWFKHEPDRWPEFRRRYFSELDERGPTLQTIRDALRGGNVTLLFAARNTRQNHALAIIEYLSESDD